MTGRQAETSARFASYLVLAHSGDGGARQVAAALERRHRSTRVETVSDRDLAHANWNQRQNADGITSRVTLKDGRSLTNDGFALVFNRLHAVFPYRFAAADEADQQYAQSEMNAVVLSWLSSFVCPVIPAPAPPALSPMLPSLPELFVQAGKVGLPTRQFAFTSNARDASPTDAPLSFFGQSPPPAQGLETEPVARYQLGRDPAIYLERVAGTPRRFLVVGEEVLGPVPGELGPACVQFARESGCAVLALQCDRREESVNVDSSRWCLVGADSHPSFDNWDEVNAVARYLEQRAAEGHGPSNRIDRGEHQWKDT